MAANAAMVLLLLFLLKWGQSLSSRGDRIAKSRTDDYRTVICLSSFFYQRAFSTVATVLVHCSFFFSLRRVSPIPMSHHCHRFRLGWTSVRKCRKSYAREEELGAVCWQLRHTIRWCTVGFCSSSKRAAERASNKKRIKEALIEDDAGVRALQQVLGEHGP